MVREEKIASTDVERPLDEYIAKEIGVRVEDDELVPENFGSLRQLAEFVGRKRSP